MLPVVPEYPNVREKIDAALEDIQAHGAQAGEDGAVGDYLDELERFARVFLTEVDRDSLRSIQKKFSGIAKGLYRVYERAKSANLPSECRLDLTTSEVHELYFAGAAAGACRSATEKIAEAPGRAVQRDGSRLERFIALQGDFGQIYLELADRLEAALLPRVQEGAAEVVSAYRKAGRHRIANMRALEERDDARSRAASRRFAKHNAKASRLARSLGLVFCKRLL